MSMSIQLTLPGTSRRITVEPVKIPTTPPEVRPEEPAADPAPEPLREPVPA
jgi:hypothetical protein